MNSRSVSPYCPSSVWSNDCNNCWRHPSVYLQKQAPPSVLPTKQCGPNKGAPCGCQGEWCIQTSLISDTSPACQCLFAFAKDGREGEPAEGEWDFWDGPRVSRPKFRGAFSLLSNGLLAINNPSFYSTTDQTKVIPHVICMFSELEMYSAESRTVLELQQAYMSQNNSPVKDCFLHRCTDETCGPLCETQLL